MNVRRQTRQADSGRRAVSGTCAENGAKDLDLDPYQLVESVHWVHEHGISGPKYKENYTVRT